MAIANSDFVSLLPPYFIQNKTCIISGEMIITASTGAVIRALGKDLPIPYKTSAWLWGIAYLSSTKQVYRIGINDNGELCTVYQDMPAGNYVIPGLSYFIE